MKYLINNLSTNWKDFINQEFKRDYLIKIDEYLSNLSEQIFPLRENIFRAFNFFNIEDTKIVIFGQDPYHNLNQADGLAFSVDNDIKTPPSLKNIFKKLSIDKNIVREDSNLIDWAKQSILLLNTTLTVSYNKPNSHKKIGWFELVISVINCLNKNTNPILFVLFGNESKRIEKYIDTNIHKIIVWPHPSPLAAHRCGFFDNDLFNQIDDFMLQNYKHTIKWI